MKKTVFIVVFVLLLLPSISAEDESYTSHLSILIPEAESVSTILTECFVEINISKNHCQETDNSIMLSWWLWSDETNSNWPDDDAKSRASLFNLSVDNEFQSSSFFNGQNNQQDAVMNADSIDSMMPIIDLTGEIIMAEGDLESWYLRMPIEMTPSVNLTDDTILYIFLSKEKAEDHHGRIINNLIYDMKPEIGFGNGAGNTTTVEWLMSSEHLEAAGVDFEEDPYGWKLTMAFFGAVENDSGESQLLSLHHFNLPAVSQNIDATSLFIPLLIMILLGIIAFALISQMFRNEKGMPKITAYWKANNSLVVKIKSFSQKMEIKSFHVDEPWKMKNNPKSRFIEPEQIVEIELRFKEIESDECQVGIQVEVDELGAWTQYLVLESPKID